MKFSSHRGSGSSDAPSGGVEPATVLATAPPLDIAVAFRTEPPPLDFVAAGLKVGTVGILASPGGVGKSFVSLELAMGVAEPDADRELLNVGIRESGRVLVLNAEDPLDVLHERVYGIGTLLSRDLQDAVAANLEIVSLTGQRPNLLDPRWVDSISSRCVATQARLLVIDTFSRFHAGDENANSDMSEVVGALEVVAQRSGAAVLALHHTSKAAALNGQQASQQSTRGASAIVDNARWQAYLEVMSEAKAKEMRVPIELRRHFVSFGVSKQNYGRPTMPRWLVRLDKGVLVNVDEGVQMRDAVSRVQDLISYEVPPLTGSPASTGTRHSPAVQVADRVW